jgi:hypothetical protein
MTDRPQSRPSNRPPAGPQGSGFLVGLVALARLGLLAILFFGTLNVVVSLVHSAAVSRTTGASLGTTYLALGLAATAAILMVALTLNAAFLVDRLFTRRVAGVLFAATLALVVASVGVGRLGGAKLLASTILFVLVPGFAFVLSMLLVRMVGPAPNQANRRRATTRRTPAAGASQRPTRPQQRQRRGGRNRR